MPIHSIVLEFDHVTTKTQKRSKATNNDSLDHMTWPLQCTLWMTCDCHVTGLGQSDETKHLHVHTYIVVQVISCSLCRRELDYRKHLWSKRMHPLTNGHTILYASITPAMCPFHLNIHLFHLPIYPFHYLYVHFITLTSSHCRLVLVTDPPTEENEEFIDGILSSHLLQQATQDYPIPLLSKQDFNEVHYKFIGDCYLFLDLHCMFSNQRDIRTISS